MKIKFKEEVAPLALVCLPFIYLAFVWEQLGEKVPIHWNIAGEIDRWGPKYILLILPFLIPGLVYLIFLAIQRFSSDQKLQKMGKKFRSLKFIMVLFMSMMTVFIIHSSKEGAVGQPTFLFVILGLLFATLGNFFKTIQPNYFLGIRTPWTLRHESVWKSTHKMGGQLWFVGGLLVTIIALISTSVPALIAIMTILGVISIIPIVYSYLEARKIKCA